MRTWMILPVMLTGLSLSLALSGCKKDELEPPPPLLDESGQIMNRKCPMCGTYLDQTIWAEYEGKKIYFDTKECKNVFEREQDQKLKKSYLRSLPQFGGKE